MAKKQSKVKKPVTRKREHQGRKLFFLPLIFSMEEPEPELEKLLDKYWQQAREQLEKLESEHSQVSKVLHELISDTGDNGIKAMDEMDTGSNDIVRDCLKRNAEFHPIEDWNMLREFIDWSQCISVGIMTEKVFKQVDKFYREVQQKRQQHIAEVINKTLKSGDIGLLVMREGCNIQFPSDMEVFYITPPVFEEVKQWFWQNGYEYGVD